MNRLSVQHFIIIGLFFWGLPAMVIAGPRALLYTIAAAIPVWLFSLRSPKLEKRSGGSLPRLGPTAAFILIGCAVTYFLWDATLGQKLLQYNLFLHGTAAVERSVDQSVAGESQGRGIAGLLGTILSLLPFALIDVSLRTRRLERWALWAAALLLLFYGIAASRGAALIAILVIALGRSSNWRRLALAGGAAVALFFVASLARGDFGNTGTPLLEAFGAPYFNLTMMLTKHCGNAPWYAFMGEFFKKFIPGFIYPKTVYSFNLETSYCIYPGADNTITAISIFTWLGEMFYYTPSTLTAICAGILLGALARIVNSMLVKNELVCGRIAVGIACIVMLRSRSQDVLSFLIAQVAFLFAWPHLCRLSIYLRHCVAAERSHVTAHEAGHEAH